MPSTAWPSVIDAVQSIATAALPSLRVVRGRDITNDADDVAMVGTQDGQPGPANAGSFQQTMLSFGGPRAEVGTVNGVIRARTGNDDQDEPTTNAFTYLAALEAAVRADPTLGLTGYEYVVAEIQSGDVLEELDDYGATTFLPFTIAYKIGI